jgi:hypothetical protein
VVAAAGSLGKALAVPRAGEGGPRLDNLKRLCELRVTRVLSKDEYDWRVTGDT